MCQGTTKAGKPCRRLSEPFCDSHRPYVSPGSNRAALEADIVAREVSASPMLELCRTLADELDRQAGDARGGGLDGMNAALVGRYLEAIGGLVVDDVGDGNDPIGDVLAQILDTAPTGAT